MNTISCYISLIPIIIFIVEIIVILGLSKKLAPLACLVISMLLGMIYLIPHNIYKGMIIGILLTSSCIGFYSGIKNIFEYFYQFIKFNKRKE